MIKIKDRISRAVAYIKGKEVDGLTEGGLLLMHPIISGVAMSDDDSPIARASKGVFCVFYLVDEGDKFSFITLSELKASGLTLEEVHSIGLNNLLKETASAKPGLSLLPQKDFYGLVMGGNFEASLLLLDDLWERALKKYAPNGFIVAVPARDMCIFCDAKSKNGIEELKRIVLNATENADHLISTKLFIRDHDRWVVFDDAIPAS